MMGLSDTTMSRLTRLNLTIGFHPRRRQWMIQRTLGDRREIVRFYRDRKALQEAVLRLTRP